MSLNQKLRLGVLVAATALGAIGCGGINTTQSVSPATFLLPGFMQIQPEKKADNLDESGEILAARSAATQTRIP